MAAQLLASSGALLLEYEVTGAATG